MDGVARDVFGKQSRGGDNGGAVHVLLQPEEEGGRSKASYYWDSCQSHMPVPSISSCHHWISRS
jgi:hypothetical protein